MARTMTILPFLLGLPAGMAVADDDCLVPMARWQPRAAVVRMAEAQGWTLRRIKIDDGCYKINGIDARGRPFEVRVNPATLQVIGVGPGDAEEKADPDGHKSGHDND